MKLRIGFVTNSSSSSYLIIYGDVERGKLQMSILKEALQKRLIEAGYEKEFAQDSDFLDVYYTAITHGGFEMDVIHFKVASGIPYHTSIKDLEQEYKDIIEGLGFKILNVNSEIEERWD